MSRWVDVVRRDNPPPDDESPTTFVRADDIPTTYVPVVTAAPAGPPPAPQSWVRRIAPWAAFGVVAVVVVAGTTAWSASLRGPEHSLGAAPTLAQVPVLTPAAPAPTPEPTTAAQEETSAARATRERARTTARSTPSTVPPPVAPPAVQPQEPAPPAPTSAATTTTPRATRPPLFPAQPTATCSPGRPTGSGAPCRTATPPSGPR